MKKKKPILLCALILLSPSRANADEVNDAFKASGLNIEQHVSRVRGICAKEVSAFWEDWPNHVSEDIDTTISQMIYRSNSGDGTFATLRLKIQKEQANYPKVGTGFKTQALLDICVLNYIASLGGSSPSTNNLPSPAPTAEAAAQNANNAQYFQRVVKTYNAVINADNALMASPNLTSSQKSLVSIWSVNLRQRLIDLMSKDTITAEFLGIESNLSKLKEGRIKGCSDAVSAGDKQLCIDGAFFGSADQRAEIERAGLKSKPPEEKQPKLKRVPTDGVNRCLALETGGLYGGFVNSCDYSVMVVWCIESPPKDSWGDSFRCINRSKTNALEVVGARSRITAHTRSGNVVMFACAWQSKSGPGPDGIWGEAIYNEGVGTSGILRGTCGEQVLVPG